MTSLGQPRLTWNGRASSPTTALARLEPAKTTSDPDTVACTLIEGDNLLALRCLGEELPGAVTLAYLDPPFFTGREHFTTQRTRTSAGVTQETERAAFDDRWDSLGDYLNALGARIELIRPLLAPHGSLVLHVDPKTSHYAKVMCDEIFGSECFASEVVWRYRRWPSKTNNFQRVHDVMLRYVRDPETTARFNQLYEPLSASTLKTWGDKKQKAVTNATGRRTRSSTTEETSRGTPLGDVWDIGIIAPVARERTGYPTQKPEALLRRWVQACTQAGDLVLDPYMGSGTTLATACSLGRRAIGIDQGAEALSVTRARLEARAIPFATRRVTAPLARGKPRDPLSRVVGL